jgi:hypothetical protein
MKASPLGLLAVFFGPMAPVVKGGVPAGRLMWEVGWWWAASLVSVFLIVRYAARAAHAVAMRTPGTRLDAAAAINEEVDNA